MLLALPGPMAQLRRTLGIIVLFFIAFVTRSPARGPSIVIDVTQRLESAAVLANHVAVQGLPYDLNDDVEVGFWRRLGPRNEGVALIADADYFGAAIRVHRATTPEQQIKRANPAWKGPFGSRRDLWLDTSEFDANLQYLRERLNQAGDRVFFGLGGTPRVLSSNGSAEDYMHLSPSNDEEWRAVVEAAVGHLMTHGFTSPTIFGPDTEPETYFRGLDRKREDRQAIARDYARMFVQSARAVERANARARLIAPGNATYSSRITRDLQRDARQWGLEEFLQFVREADPSMKLRGVSWQGYYWYKHDGFGRERLVAGAEYVASLLRQQQQPADIPQFLLGWSPTAYNGGFDDTAFFTPRATRFYRETLEHAASHIVSEAIRFANPGGRRLIDTAFFYTWNGDGTPGCGGGFARGNLVSTVHQGADNPSGDPNYPDCRLLPSTVACPRAPYEAMMWLKETSDGSFVKVVEGAEQIKIAAVAKDDAVKLLAAHTHHKPLSGLTLEVRGLQPGQTYLPVMRTVVSDERLCAAVTKTPLPLVKGNQSGTVKIAVPNAQPLFLILLSRQ